MLFCNISGQSQIQGSSRERPSESPDTMLPQNGIKCCSFPNSHFVPQLDNILCKIELVFYAKITGFTSQTQDTMEEDTSCLTANKKYF